MPNGPCVICGATNYPLSLGGPDICPSCDCGPPNPKQVRELGEAYNKLFAESMQTASDNSTLRTRLAEVEGRLGEAEKLLKEVKPYFCMSPLPYADSIYKKLKAFLAPKDGEMDPKEAQQCDAACPHSSFELLQCSLVKGHTGPHNWVSQLKAGATP